MHAPGMHRQSPVIYYPGHDRSVCTREFRAKIGRVVTPHRVECVRDRTASGSCDRAHGSTAGRPRAPKLKIIAERHSLPTEMK